MTKFSMQQAATSAPGFACNPKSIDIAPHLAMVMVKAGEAVLAATRKAKRLDEEGFAPVIYIPFEDTRFANLERAETKTRCPYKGDASYWRLAEAVEPQDIMWAYETLMTRCRSSGTTAPSSRTVPASRKATPEAA